MLVGSLCEPETPLPLNLMFQLMRRGYMDEALSSSQTHQFNGSSRVSTLSSTYWKGTLFQNGLIG